MGWDNQDNCFQNGRLDDDTADKSGEDSNSEDNSSLEQSADMTTSDEEAEVAEMLRVRNSMLRS